MKNHKARKRKFFASRFLVSPHPADWVQVSRAGFMEIGKLSKLVEFTLKNP
jgi:hypothetical protein